MYSIDIIIYTCTCKDVDLTESCSKSLLFYRLLNVINRNSIIVCLYFLLTYFYIIDVVICTYN